MFAPVDCNAAMEVYWDMVKIRLESARTCQESEEEKMKEAIKPLAGFKFGCDPELFIVDSKGNAIAPTMIPGTKDAPFKVDCGAIQRDGMAAEINIDPVDNFEDFDKNLDTVLASLEAMLPRGCKLVDMPSVIFSDEEFAKAEDKDKVLGCTPDWNAWTGCLTPTPAPELCPYGPTFRAAGGHLHISWTKDADLTDIQHIINCQDLVKQLDWYLAAWALQVDKDKRRRELYGKAGACRYKHYGVEYRVLSNFWVLKKGLRLETWNRMQQAILDLSTYFVPDKAGGYNSVLESCVNAGKRNDAIEQLFSYPIRTLTKPDNIFGSTRTSMKKVAVGG